jgi:hypothetical protein
MNTHHVACVFACLHAAFSRCHGVDFSLLKQDCISKGQRNNSTASVVVWSSSSICEAWVTEEAFGGWSANYDTVAVDVETLKNHFTNGRPGERSR